MRSQRGVRRIGPDRLSELALEAIEEAAAASHLGPVPRTRGLALALAWLLHYGKEGETLPRWPFESFWEGLSNEREHDRWSAVNAAANAIYLALAEQRDRQRQSTFERSAKHQARALPSAGREGAQKVPNARRD
jgi:hypothetical protein